MDWTDSQSTDRQTGRQRKKLTKRETKKRLIQRQNCKESTEKEMEQMTRKRHSMAERPAKGQEGNHTAPDRQTKRQTDRLRIRHELLSRNGYSNKEKKRWSGVIVKREKE